MTQRSRGGVYDLAMIGVMSALFCVLAPLSIPIGPVPISLLSLVLYFSLYLLGGKKATLSYLVYLGLGMVGIPVFSGFRGGLGHLFGPTGGYLIGFLPMGLLAGPALNRPSRVLHLAGLLGGTAVAYAFGTLWYCLISGSALLPAASVCVFPFIPCDLLKIAAAVLAGPVLRRRLQQAGVPLPS